MDYRVSRRRVEYRPPDPDEDLSYKERTTVTHDAHAPLPGPPQETGTMTPHD